MSTLPKTEYPNNIRNVVAGNVVSQTVYQNDSILNCDTSGAGVPFAITLLEIPDNNWNTIYKLYVSDTGNNASVRNITISAPVGQTINNQASVTLNTNGSAVLIRVTDNKKYIATYNANGGMVINIEIAGNGTGTLLTATASGGVAPYTYLWSEAQNVQNRFLAPAQVQTPSTVLTLVALGIAFVGGVTPNGTSVMWKCKVTDAVGNFGIGYFTNVSQGA